MSAEKVRIYDACDKAIQEMNRENLKSFGKLKLAKWDQLNIVKEVTKLYHESARKARKKYYDEAFEVYLLVLGMFDDDPAEVREKAEKSITSEWVEEILTQTNLVTLYRFDSETDRKAYRLVEALGATESKDEEIDKALRLWSKQLGQYAINFTDYAAVKAFKDAGVEMVEWITRHDERVCNECYALDGQIFRIDEIPRKPHWGCRCFWKAVFRKRDSDDVEQD